MTNTSWTPYMGPAPCTTCWQQASGRQRAAGASWTRMSNGVWIYACASHKEVRR